jgi:succinate-semialdehyde dehydrogenase/glutarate-semialdehyde dehydrogenase
LTTLFLAGLFEEAGLPPGVLNVITTVQAPAVSETLMTDRRLRKVSFTGSTRVGKVLMRQAADNVLRTSMELGGNAPFLVFEDADLSKSVEGALQAKFRNIGQACTAANRFLVHRSVADEFTARLAERVAALRIGRGTDPEAEVGPLIHDEAARRVDALVQDAVARGAEVVTGGCRGDGAFYRPTVLRGVPFGCEILGEEIFGPVITIVEFDDEDEAVRLANDTEYGLVSYVFTESLARGTRMIDRLETGMMGLNVGVLSNAAAPFGGVKHSGVGREGGAEGIQEYLASKYTLIPG